MRSVPSGIVYALCLREQPEPRRAVAMQSQVVEALATPPIRRLLEAPTAIDSFACLSRVSPA